MSNKKREYELTENEIKSLLDLSLPDPWLKIAEKYGFDPDIIEFTDGKIITAVPIDIPDVEMFKPNTNITDQIGILAERVAIEMDAVDKLKKEHSSRKDALDAEKERLSVMLTDAGMKSCALECGLTPCAKVNRKYNKNKEVDDYQLHDWLRTPRVIVSLAVVAAQAIVEDNIDRTQEMQPLIDFLCDPAVDYMVTLESVIDLCPEDCYDNFIELASDLGDVIIPYVHYMTLQSTLKAFEEQGGEIDSTVFNVSTVPTITMRGKSAYLAAKGV